MSDHRGNYTYGYTSDRQARRNSAEKVRGSRGARTHHSSSSRHDEAGSSSSQARTGDDSASQTYQPGYNAGYTDENQRFDSPPPISNTPIEGDLKPPTTCGLEERVNGQPVLDPRTQTWESCGNPLEPGLNWCLSCKPLLYCNFGGCSKAGQELYLGAGFACNWHFGTPKSYEAIQRERAERDAAAAVAPVPQVRPETREEREAREAQAMADAEAYQRRLDDVWRR